MRDGNESQESFLKDIVKFAIVALLIVVPIRFFVAQPFIVSGASMEPSFESGQYLIVDQLTYHFETPLRGDVIIFKYPKDPSKYFIKRVIGLPGETVRIEGKNVYIENNEHPSGYIIEEPYLEADNIVPSSTKITLDSDEYYVLGDNRKASSDSRVWGPLSQDSIVGRAFLRLLPVTKTDVFPGGYTIE